MKFQILITGAMLDFQLVVDLIEDGSKGLIEHLKKELGLS